MVRIQREPRSNCKIPDYVPRDIVNSVALRAIRIGAWLGHIGEIQNMLPFVVAAKHKVYGILALVL